jgi:hypothetical protein
MEYHYSVLDIKHLLTLLQIDLNSTLNRLSGNIKQDSGLVVP